MLLDTAGLLCIHHDAEPHNRSARALFRAARRRFTHNLMGQRGIYEALTTDHHFEQEGFRCLLG
jgi:hypothetical protein